METIEMFVDVYAVGGTLSFVIFVAFFSYMFYFVDNDREPITLFLAVTCSLLASLVWFVFLPIVLVTCAIGYIAVFIESRKEG